MSAAEPLNFQVEIVDATDIEARIEVRVLTSDRQLFDSDCGLSGTVTGPFCERTRTLPTTVALCTSESDRNVVAQATIVDPCFWTDELPFLYRLRIDYQIDGEAYHHEQSIGLARQPGG